ncbi:MAG: acyl-CoA dehydratase activase-related protein [Bacilli bacterium]|nr:acyl-CoA dehydratase activase-related protein [Bacilli bacterium]
MTNKITVGIPRSLLYYKYKYLWETFFKELGCDVILSPETNKEILNNGIKYSIDESCLSSKIYLGHIYSLIDTVDYILVPRISNFGRREVVCTKFNAIYDIVRNIFPDIPLINYNVDILKKKTELKGFIKMGLKLKKSVFESVKAYVKAKKVQFEKEKELHFIQDNLINTSNKLKLLIVAHSYNTYDRLIGYPIIEYLKELEVEPIYSDIVEPKITHLKSKAISEPLHWTYSKELIGSIEHYKEKVSGIIFITAFPCGPDSLVNELCLRKLKGIPMLNLVIDELDGETGIHTRIESFIDVVKARNNKLERVF